MVELWKSGVARAIGVSNYNSSHIKEIIDAGLPLPAVNQIPFSPMNGQVLIQLGLFYSETRSGVLTDSEVVRAEYEVVCGRNLSGVWTEAAAV
jgi:predicted oxidoreductase